MSTEITVIELDNADVSLDGTVVHFNGEAIGDVISAGGKMVWVALGPGSLEAQGNPSAGGSSLTGDTALTTTTANTADVNSGGASGTSTNASISVYMSRDDAAAITSLGRYHVEGSTLEIEGVFHLACKEHEGLSDVHATSVQQVDAGSTTAENPDVGLLIGGGVLICVGLALVLLFRFLRERLR
ncbi:MAG: hypothetical protein LBB42_02045 [Coriobacteriales bacterium]|nr:hypothetical protein [Coriobacteriales bacterium]